MELKSDIQEFVRKLRLIEFFYSENLDSSKNQEKMFLDF